LFFNDFLMSDFLHNERIVRNVQDFIKLFRMIIN
jgi:hypothetical protein